MSWKFGFACMKKRGRGQKKSQTVHWKREKSSDRSYQRLVRRESLEAVEKMDKSDTDSMEPAKSLFQEVQDVKEVDKLRKMAITQLQHSLSEEVTKGLASLSPAELSLILDARRTAAAAIGTMSGQLTTISPTSSAALAQIDPDADEGDLAAGPKLAPSMSTPAVISSYALTTSTYVTTAVTTTVGPSYVTIAGVRQPVSYPLQVSSGATKKKGKSTAKSQQDPEPIPPIQQPSLHDKMDTLLTMIAEAAKERAEMKAMINTNSKKLDKNYQVLYAGFDELKKDQESLKSEFKEFKADVKVIKERERILEGRVTTVEDRVELLEEQLRRPNIVIKSLPEKTPDDLRDRIIQWVNNFEMECAFSHEEIISAYRVGQRRGKTTPRNVLVKFACVADKMRVMNYIKQVGPTALKFEGIDIEIYNDVSVGERIWRQTMKPVTKWLRDKGIRYNWIFPRQFVFWHAGRRFLVKEDVFVLDTLVAANLLSTNSPEWKLLKDALLISGGAHSGGPSTMRDEGSPQGATGGV